jgi:hypothetical protein
MGWTLQTPAGTRLNVNAWNWRPTLALLERRDLLDPEKLELLGYTVEVEVTAEEAGRIARFLDGYLADVPADGRVLLDGAVTTTPDTGELHRDDPARNYSATATWLRKFRDFCHTATDGFTAG